MKAPDLPAFYQAVMRFATIGCASEARLIRLFMPPT
jgi:hypothetical protein